MRFQSSGWIVTGIISIVAILVAPRASAQVNAGGGDEVDLKLKFSQTQLAYQPAGRAFGMEIKGGRPVVLTPTAPEGLKNLPKFAGKSQLYGVLEIGDNRWNIVIDGDSKTDSLLYVDANKNLDFGDDKTPCKYLETEVGAGFSTAIDLELSPQKKYAVGILSTIGVAQYKDKPMLLPYANCHWKGKIAFGDVQYDVAAFDASPDGDYSNDAIFIDVNRNGIIELPIEQFFKGEVRRIGNALFCVTDISQQGDKLGYFYGDLNKSANRLGLTDAAEELAKLPIKGNPASPFTFKDFKSGTEYSLDNLKGSVVLIDFWATWCAPCRAEMPNVKALYEKYKDKKFQIVGISLDMDSAQLTEYLEKEGMKWPQYFDGRGWENRISQLYKIQSVPATFLIDRDGKIAAVGIRGEELAKKLAELIEGKEK